jgi:hypothetical protein
MMVALMMLVLLVAFFGVFMALVAFCERVISSR